MKLLIERTIELLNLQVKENLQLINKNQSRLLEIMKQPFSGKKKQQYEECYDTSMKLLCENNDFMTMQLSLIDFLEKYKESAMLSDDVPQEYLEMPEDEEIIFTMTVDGELKYDCHHPMFGNSDFFDRLIGYFSSIEAYEKCSELNRTRKTSFSSK